MFYTESTMSVNWMVDVISKSTLFIFKILLSVHLLLFLANILTFIQTDFVRDFHESQDGHIGGFIKLFMHRTCMILQCWIFIFRLVVTLITAEEVILMSQLVKFKACHGFSNIIAGIATKFSWFMVALLLWWCHCWVFQMHESLVPFQITCINHK